MLSEILSYSILNFGQCRVKRVGIVIKGGLSGGKMTFAGIRFRQVTYSNLLGVVAELLRTSI